MQNEILNIISPSKVTKKHVHFFEGCDSNPRAEFHPYHAMKIIEGVAFGSYLGYTSNVFRPLEEEETEYLNPVQKFLRTEFEVLPDYRTISNFVFICTNILNSWLINLIEDDDIYVEENGAISIEIYKENLKTFISIGKESCGYYIRKENEIIAKENNIPLSHWVYGNISLQNLKDNLYNYYLNPSVDNYSFMLFSGIK